MLSLLRFAFACTVVMGNVRALFCQTTHHYMSTLSVPAVSLVCACALQRNVNIKTALRRQLPRALKSSACSSRLSTVVFHDRTVQLDIPERGLLRATNVQECPLHGVT